MLYREFYAALAKLVYAIAYIDGKISDKEKEKLKTLVRKELIPAEKHIDTFGTDAAYYVEIEFDVLEEQMVEPEDAFNSFIGFIEKHSTAISQPMRDMALQIARQIAEASFSINKKENQLIKRLQKELKALPGK
jgi:hypothetical protein